MTQVESVTPKNDITWYVKWACSLILLIGIAIGERGAAIDGYEWIDNICSWIGAVGWTYVGFKWNDRALILVNGIFAFILTAGLFRIFLT